MKITYEFDNGDVVTVQVSDEIGKWILASRRREASDDRYHRRYCYSLDATNDKTDWVATRQYNPEDMIDRMIEEVELELSRDEKHRRFRNAMTYLTKKEQELLHALIYEGKTQAVYAREHCCDKGLISRRYKSAIQKIFLKNRRKHVNFLLKNVRYMRGTFTSRERIHIHQDLLFGGGDNCEYDGGLRDDPCGKR